MFPATVPEYFEQGLKNQIDQRPESYKEWRKQTGTPEVTEQDKVKVQLCLNLGLFCKFGESGA